MGRKQSQDDVHTIIPVKGHETLIGMVVTVSPHGSFYAWPAGTTNFVDAEAIADASDLDTLEAKARRAGQRDKIRINVPFSTRDGEGRYTGRNRRTGNWDYVIVKKGGQSSSGQDWRPQTGSYHDTKLRPLTPAQRAELDRLIKAYQEASERHDKFIEKHRYDGIEVAVIKAWKAAGGDTE